jgi:hypothetical protein
MKFYLVLLSHILDSNNYYHPFLERRKLFMSVILNLASNDEGSLKFFLDSYFEKDSKLDNDVIEWVNVFNKPLEAIDMMTAAMDNKEKFNIILRISIDPELFVDVNHDNLDDIIKYMLFRFYKYENDVHL